MSTEKNIDIQELSQAERILLAEELWDSIVTQSDTLKVTAEQKQILDARLANYQADPEAGTNWDSIKDEMK